MSWPLGPLGPTQFDNRPFCAVVMRASTLPVPCLLYCCGEPPIRPPACPCLLPLRPRWFMKPMHTNPQDAVQIHQDVRSKKSIGVHCCTFYLTTGTHTHHFALEVFQQGAD